MIEGRHIRPLLFCAIILVLIPNLHSAEASQILSSNDELIRWSIMSAERFLQVMDHPLSDYVNNWISINRSLPMLTDRNLIAKTKLINLELLSRALSSWSKWSRMPEYNDWLRSNSEIIYFNDSEDQGWFIRTAEYWKLFENSKGLNIADKIAWEAANNPEPQWCESDLPCYFQSLDRTFVRYLQLFPDGLYASLALDKIHAFCLNFKNSSFFRARLDELFRNASTNRGGIFEKDTNIIKQVIGNIADRLANHGPSVSSVTARQTNEIFFSYLYSYLHKQGPQYSPSFTKEKNKRPERAEDSNRFNLENLRYQINCKFNLELIELIDIWNRLDSIAMDASCRDLRAQSELQKIKCMKRIASLAASNPNPSSSTADWITKHGEYFHYGKLRTDFIWKSFDMYRDLPTSDDFAWEALNYVSVNPASDDEGSVYKIGNQLNAVLMTFGRYLQLMPDGKYSSIAIEKITEFLDSCLKQNAFRLPPFGIDDISKSEFLSFQKSLKDILASLKNARAPKTIETLAAIERAINNHVPKAGSSCS